jgi:hypothetical protein
MADLTSALKDKEQEAETQWREKCTLDGQNTQLSSQLKQAEDELQALHRQVGGWDGRAVREVRLRAEGCRFES